VYLTVKSTGEAAHPALTLMDTCCKQMPNCPCLAKQCEAVVEFRVPRFLSMKPGQALLQVTSPAPGGFSTQGTKASAGSLGGNSCIMAAIGFSLCVCGVG